MTTETIEQQLTTIARRHEVDLVGFARLDQLQLAHPPRPAEELLPGARSVVALAAGLLWGALHSPHGTRGAVKDAQLAYHRLEAAGAAMGRHLEAAGFASYLPPASMPVEVIRHGLQKQYAAEWSQRQAAIAAGLGVRGANNLLVTPEFGPHVRLGSLITAAALEPSERPLPPGLCDNCRKCVDACPVGALGASVEQPLDPIRCRKNYVRPFLHSSPLGTIRALLQPGYMTQVVQTLLEGYHFSCAECQRICPRGGLKARSVAQRRGAGDRSR